MNSTRVRSGCGTTADVLGNLASFQMGKPAQGLFSFNTKGLTGWKAN